MIKKMVVIIETHFFGVQIEKNTEIKVIPPLLFKNTTKNVIIIR